MRKAIGPTNLNFPSSIFFRATSKFSVYHGGRQRKPADPLGKVLTPSTGLSSVTFSAAMMNVPSPPAGMTMSAHCTISLFRLLSNLWVTLISMFCDLKCIFFVAKVNLIKNLRTKIFKMKWVWAVQFMLYIHIQIIDLFFSTTAKVSVCQGCDLTKVKNPEKWVAGLGLHLVSRIKPPEPPGCLILEDLHCYRLSSFGHNTGYFFLSLVANSLLSRKGWGKGRFVKKILKSGKILRNHMPGMCTPDIEDEMLIL